jgi:2-dehydropantoate 2-reductase
LPNLRPSHVVIIGPGAIGACLAMRLATAADGPRVTLIDHRPDRAARLSGRPIVVHTPDGDLEKIIPVLTAPDAPPDLVILAVKAHAAPAAAAAAAGWIGQAPVVAMQNGLGAAAEAAQALPAAQVITAVSYQAANRVGEGEFIHVANLETLLGYEGRPPDAAASAVAAMFNAAGLPARVEADMTPAVWGKLLINAALNPVAALAGVVNGEVALRRTLRAMAQAIAEEGEATARAAGVALPSASAAEATMEGARRTAANRCSMLQDIEAGRMTEIEYLNAAIVRTAEAHGVAVPTNRAITALVRQVSGAMRKAE